MLCSLSSSFRTSISFGSNNILVSQVLTTLIEGYSLYCFFAILVTNLGGPIGVILKVQKSETDFCCSRYFHSSCCCPDDAIVLYQRSQRVLARIVVFRTLLCIVIAICSTAASSTNAVAKSIILITSLLSFVVLIYSISCLLNICKAIFISWVLHIIWREWFCYAVDQVSEACRNVYGASKVLLLVATVLLIVLQGLGQQFWGEWGDLPFKDDSSYSAAEKLQKAYCKFAISTMITMIIIIILLTLLLGNFIIFTFVIVVNFCCFC